MAKTSTPHFATLTVAASQLRAAARHSKIQLVTDNVYMVRGKMPSTPSRPLFERVFLYYSRTMTIVRSKNSEGGYDLTLINALRLNDKALAQLSELGEVKHIVRLGSFHGVDDAFYVQHYAAKYWVVDGMKSAPGLAIEPEILSDTNLPFTNSRLFSFHGLTYPEAIIILSANDKRAGVAITTDAVQNHRSIFDINNSPLVSLAIWRIGLAGKARLGPIWMREQTAVNPSEETLTPEEKEHAMAAFFIPQFNRLLAECDFDMLMPGHGWPIYEGAKAAISASMNSQLRPAHLLSES